ncbi:MAG: crosslink repair DNA glycosylase YcaQ family protein [Armatimonadota bacterium]
MQQTITIDTATARRFLLEAHGLTGFQKFPDVGSAIQHLQFLQEDSINVCGRMHDLILWPRVADYSPDKLATALYSEPRQAFEYYFPNLSALPIAEYPYFVRSMRARVNAPGRWHSLSPEESEVAAILLERMQAEGPMRTRTNGDEHGHTMSGWGTRTRVATRVLEKLWLQGHVAVARREGFERWFHRADLIFPELVGLHADETRLPALEEERRFLAQKRLRARRLFKLKRGEADLLGATSLVKVQIENVPQPWFILQDDLTALERIQADPVLNQSTEAILLAPLDPLVYDRSRNRAVFDFDYTWEVYVPQAKRRWGYYVLPILYQDKLIGRVDPKIDRKTATLHLVSLTLETEVDAEAAAEPVLTRLYAFARFLGAEQIAFEKRAVPKAFHRPLSKFKA